MPGNKRCRGFTLIEVVAAIALLGLGLAILYAGYLQATNLQAKYAEAGTALALAKSKLAQVEAGEETSRGGDCEGEPGYAWEAEIGQEDENGQARCAVTVTWRRASKGSVTVWTVMDKDAY